MNGYIDRVAAFFGIGPLEFRLSPADRNRLRYASIAPLVLILGDFALLWLQIFKDVPYNDFYTRGSVWAHIYLFIQDVQPALIPIAVALLFLFGIYPVSRAQGSAAFVITVVLVNLAAVALVLASVPPIFYDDLTPYTDWYVENWSNFAYDFGILAIGYAFLAYRGLGHPKRRLTRRLARPTGETDV